MITLKQIQVDPSEGLRRTLYEMDLLEKKAMQNVDFVKWVNENFNTDCPACIPGKIWNYMQDNYSYKKDSPTDEVLIAPYLMPEFKAGDCDDFSLFTKSVMDILGLINPGLFWFTHYLLLGKYRGKFTHIVVFAHRGQTGNNYVDPVYIDGANTNFNIIPSKYNYYKIL